MDRQNMAGKVIIVTGAGRDWVRLLHARSPRQGRLFAVAMSRKTG